MLTTHRGRNVLACMILATLLFATLAPAIALAATAPPGSIGDLSSTVQELPDGSVVLIVAGKLTPSSKLPAQIALPIPKGSKVQWAGEITGSDPAADPAVTYKVEPGATYDLVRMVISRAREAQVEVDFSSAAKVTGDKHVVEGTLHVPYAVPEARLALRVPPGGKLVSTQPKMSGQPGPEGYTYYAVSRTPASAGTVLKAQLVYTGGSEPAAAGSASGANPGGASGDAGSPVPGLLLVGGVVAIVAVVALMRLAAKRREAVGSGTDQEDSDGDDDPSAGPDRGPEPDSEPGDVVFALEELDDDAPARPAAAGKGSSPSTAEKTSGGTSQSVSDGKPISRGRRMSLILVAVVVVGVIAVAYLGAGRTAVVQGGKQSEQDGIQRITVDTRGGEFNPGEFRAKAGKPIELVFGAGTGCSSRITFTDLNIDQDLRYGGTVKIPALKAGKYQYLCGSGSPSGALVVE
jgi:hypothetical protein